MSNFNQIRFLSILFLIIIFRINTYSDVIYPEPNAHTIKNCAVVAVVKLEEIKGNGRFTHKHPPDLIFRVTNPLKGCVIGQMLFVKGWRNLGKPFNMKGYSIPDSTTQKWELTDVKIPSVDDSLIIFLLQTKDGLVQYTGIEPVYIKSPKNSDINFVKGISSLKFSLDVKDGRDGKINIGQPILLCGFIENLTDTIQVFDPKDFVISFTWPGAHDAQTFEYENAIGLPMCIELKSYERKDISWDLCRFVPLLFPGQNSIGIRVPAADFNGWSDLHFWFTLKGEPFFSDIVKWAPVTLIATMKQVVMQPRGEISLYFDEREYLKGQKYANQIPMQIDWNKGKPVPLAGTRMIICMGHSLYTLLYAEEATAEKVILAKKIIDSIMIK